MKASEVKKGNVVEHNNGIYQVRDIERSSPTARGGNVTFRSTAFRAATSSTSACAPTTISRKWN